MKKNKINFQSWIYLQNEGMFSHVFVFTNRGFAMSRQRKDYMFCLIYGGGTEITCTRWGGWVWNEQIVLMQSDRFVYLLLILENDALIH